MVKVQVRLSTMEEEVLRVNADKFNLRGHGERMDPGRKWVKSKIRRRRRKNKRKKERTTKVANNNGQLCIATPPLVAHASRLGQLSAGSSCSVMLSTYSATE